MSLTKEQLEVIKHGKGNILVSASAGSGKTFTMIERVKRLIIEENIGINQILAVTFTEAAATDMKEKLKDALSKVICGEWSELYGQKTVEKVKWCERQLAEIDTADISTMHAFCGRLIRTYFFVVGISPDFKIIDQADASVLKNLSIDKVFKDFYDAEDQQFLNLIDRHAKGRTDKNLKELVLSAYDFCDSEANPNALLNLYQKFYSDDGLENLLQEYKNLLDNCLIIIKEDVQKALAVVQDAGLKKGTEFAKSLLSDINNVIDCKDVYNIKCYENYKLKLDFERSLDENLIEQKQILSDARDKFAKTLKRFLKCLGKDFDDDKNRLKSVYIHTQKFAQIVDCFKKTYSQEKRDENLLDFNDLEHFALEILSDTEIATDVKERYKYIFIDEYQDTNGVQEEIINKLSSDNVFMVGDVKQSIYGFRGCRSEFFIYKERTMLERGQKVVRLNANFRSAESVLKHVNAIFNYCMTESVYGESYREKSQLIGGDGVYPDDNKGRVELHFLRKEEREKRVEEQPRIYDILKEKPTEKDTDASRLAGLINGIINKELADYVYDAKTGEKRSICYGDIAILTRSRKQELISCLLQHGLPISTDVAENICDYPEIQVVINALKLVDCFMQDLPLVSTLKSPIGKFCEEELLEIVRFYEDNKQDAHGGFSDAFNYYLASSQSHLSQRLKEFKQYFEQVRLLSDFIGAHGVIEKLVVDKSLRAHLFAEKGGRAKVDRLNMLIASTVSNGRAYSVREFLSRVKNCPDAFGMQPFTQEDTVKIMTVHASKGLEFPVVILCNLESPFNSEDDYEEIMQDRNFGLAVKYYDDQKRTKEETLVRGVIREKARIERMREEMRLFYVATTRATYSMHVIFSDKEDKRKEEFKSADRCADFLPSFIPATNHTVEEIELRRKNAETKSVLIGRAEQEKVDQIKTNLQFVYPYLSDCAIPLKASVTALSKTDDNDTVYTHVLFDDEKTDTQKGIIAHKILQHYDFCGQSIFEQVEKMIKDGILTTKEKDSVKLERIEKALSACGFLGLNDKKLYREQQFLVEIEADKLFDVDSKTPVLVQGVIDLLIIGKDGAEIVDYKYSTLSEEGLKARYKKQLDLYAYAVEKVLEKKVVRKTLVNIFTGQTVFI